MLNMKDLGQVHYKYIKHASTGSIFFILVKKQLNLDSQLDGLSGFRSQEIGSLLDKFANVKINMNILVKEAVAATREDFGFLTAHLRCFLDFNANKKTILARGLYVGFLKLQSNIDAIKVMVNFSVPNVLPSHKIRENPNISKYIM